MRSLFKHRPSAAIIIFWCLALASFVTLAPPSVGQTSAPDAPTPPKIRFLFLDETAGHYTARLVSGIRRVSDGPYEISPPITPSDFRPFPIYKTLSNPELGTTAPVKVATISIPSGTRSILAIISPRPAPSPAELPAYGVEIIDCDPSKFPAGSIRVINRAMAPMAAQFGNDLVSVDPGADTVVHPAPDKRHRVASRIATQITSGWKIITSQTTLLLPGQRVFGVIIHSPSGMRHTYTAAELAELGPPTPGDFWLTFSDTP